MTLKFDGITKDYISAVEEIDRPYGPSRTVDRRSVTGNDGSIVTRITDEEKIFTVRIIIDATEDMTLQEVADDMVKWLYHKEPKRLVLPDHDDRFYNAYVEGGIDKESIVNFARCTITFICPDGYGQSNILYSNTAIADAVDIVNEGTKETGFKVEALALEDSPMFMITDGDNYFQVGKSEDADKELKDLAPYRFNDEFNNGKGDWQYVANKSYGTLLDGGDARGGTFEATSSNQSISVANWGTAESTNWHGAGIYKQLTASVQDFRIRLKLNILNQYEVGPSKAFAYIYDEANRVQFSIGYVNTSRYGNDGRLVGYMYDEYGDATRIINRPLRNAYKKLEFFHVFLYIERKGNMIKFTTQGYNPAEDERRQQPLDYSTKTYVDSGVFYQRPIRIANIYSGKSTKSSKRIKINILGFYIQRLLPEEEDITPVIIKAGDIVKVDTNENYVTINDEYAINEKDFGADYFKLDTGLTTLLVHPEGIFDTTVKWYDRYR